jgi:hypothetical protein
MVGPDNYTNVLQALARQRARETRDAQARHLEELGLRTKVQGSDLSVNSVASAVTAALADQKKEILEHVGRLITLIRLQRDKADDRVRTLQRRIFVLESEVRLLRKKAPR